MTDDELLRQFAREVIAAEHAELGLQLTVMGTGVDIEISPTAIFTLVGCLQLALRHPDNSGPAAEKMRDLLGWLKRHFAPAGSAREIVFLRGADEIRPSLQ